MVVAVAGVVVVKCVCVDICVCHNHNSCRLGWWACCCGVQVMRLKCRKGLVPIEKCGSLGNWWGRAYGLRCLCVVFFFLFFLSRGG